MWTKYPKAPSFPQGPRLLQRMGTEGRSSRPARAPVHPLGSQRGRTPAAAQSSSRTTTEQSSPTTSSSGSKSRSKPPSPCYKCQGNHWAGECPLRKSERKPRAPTPGRRSSSAGWKDRSSSRCSNFGEVGHWAQGCPDPPGQAKCWTCGKKAHQAFECRAGSGAPAKDRH